MCTPGILCGHHWGIVPFGTRLFDFVFVSDFVSVLKWVVPLESQLGGIQKENEEMSLLSTLKCSPGGPGSCCGPRSSGGINATPSSMQAVGGAGVTAPPQCEEIKYHL